MKRKPAMKRRSTIKPRHIVKTGLSQRQAETRVRQELKAVGAKIIDRKISKRGTITLTWRLP